MTPTPHKAVIPNDYTSKLGTIVTTSPFNSTLDISSTYFPIYRHQITYVGELNINYNEITTIINESDNCQIYGNISIGETYKLHRFIRFIINPNITIVNNNSSSDTNVSLNLTMYQENANGSIGSTNLIDTCSVKNIMILKPYMHGQLSGKFCFILDTRTKTLSYEK